jgi:hypothetical protein
MQFKLMYGALSSVFQVSALQACRNQHLSSRVLEKRPHHVCGIEMTNDLTLMQRYGEVAWCGARCGLCGGRIAACCWCVLMQLHYGFQKASMAEAEILPLHRFSQPLAISSQAWRPQSGANSQLHYLVMRPFTVQNSELTAAML